MLEVSRIGCLWQLPVSHMVGVTRPLLLLAQLLCLDPPDYLILTGYEPLCAYCFDQLHYLLLRL